MAGYQKKSSKNARLIALGFAAFILIYLFGQLWGFANLKLRTEQVDEDTIYDFVRAQGTVFRSEQLIEPVSASGVMVYNCADGDEVAMSEEWRRCTATAPSRRSTTSSSSFSTSWIR